MPDECFVWAENMDLYYIEVLEGNSKNRASRSGVQKCVSFMLQKISGLKHGPIETSTEISTSKMLQLNQSKNC